MLDCNAAAGNDDNPYRAGFAQIVVVAESDADAEKLYAPHIMNFYNKALHIPPYFSGSSGYSSKRSMVNAMNKFAEPTAFTAVPTAIDWKEAMELLRQAPQTPPLLLEIEGEEGMDVPRKMAEVFGKLENAGVAAE